MSLRRISWIAHNVIMTPFIPIRLLLLILIRIGEAAEWIGLRTPGWRMYDGWSFGYRAEDQPATPTHTGWVESGK